jgi:hypothetical protein
VIGLQVAVFLYCTRCLSSLFIPKCSRESINPVSKYKELFAGPRHRSVKGHEALRFVVQLSWRVLKMLHSGNVSAWDKQS